MWFLPPVSELLLVSGAWPSGKKLQGSSTQDAHSAENIQIIRTYSNEVFRFFSSLSHVQVLDRNSSPSVCMPTGLTLHIFLKPEVKRTSLSMKTRKTRTEMDDLGVKQTPLVNGIRYNYCRWQITLSQSSKTHQKPSNEKQIRCNYPKYLLEIFRGDILSYCWWFRNPQQPPGMYETLLIMGYLPYQLVSLPDFWTINSSTSMQESFRKPQVSPLKKANFSIDSSTKSPFRVSEHMVSLAKIGQRTASNGLSDA